MGKKRGKLVPSCAACDLEVNRRICYTKEGVGSKGCPTLRDETVLAEALKEYEDPEILEFARQASIHNMGDVPQ